MGPKGALFSEKSIWPAAAEAEDPLNHHVGPHEVVVGQYKQAEPGSTESFLPVKQNLTMSPVSFP